MQTDDVGEVMAIYVEPPAWGNGVGRGLLQEALRRPTEKNRPLAACDRSMYVELLRFAGNRTMVKAVSNPILRLIRQVVEDQGVRDASDRDLLQRFREHQDAAAFHALVRRHGPMVFDVCRGVLRDEANAEDAFQATFLILARKAVSIRKAESVGSWLHSVAYRTALQARAQEARRKASEAHAPPRQMSEPDDLTWREVRAVLHEELNELPERYRMALVMCYLESKTQDQAAAQLGMAKSTLKERLERGRELLRARLVRRGLGPAALLVAAAWPAAVASACLPSTLVSATVKAASLSVVGQATAGVISVKVAALTEGVMKAMLFTKLKAALAVVLIFGFVGTGATILTRRTAAGQDDKKPTAEKPVQPAAKQQKEKEKEGFTAWGNEVGGLQAGLGFRPGEHRAYHHGETVTLVVRVRNVGKEAVKFEYLKHFLDENPPIVTDADGKTVPQERFGVMVLAPRHAPVEVTLAPGKEIVLESAINGASGVRHELRPASARGKPSDGEYRGRPLYGTGKVSVQYERVFGNSSKGSIKLDPALSKLATGKLELEIKPDPPKEKEPEFKGRTLSQWVGQLKNGGVNERQEAVLALHELGPGAVPALAEALLKEKEIVNVRIWAAWGLRLNGPAAKAAVPQLKAALQDEFYLVSIEAAKALWVISKDKTAIPSVLKFLKSKDAGIRWFAAENLGWFGPSAKEAVPALLEALKDTGVVEMTDNGTIVGGERVQRIVEIRSVKAAAGKALKRIDPEAAKKAGVK